MSLLQKQSDGSNLKGWFMYICIPYRELFEQIRGTYFGCPNFIKFAALQPQLIQLRSQPSYM